MATTNIYTWGAIGIVLSCVIFLVIIFGITPLPYIIAAAVLKIPNRNYWKAFGSAILGGIAGAAASIIVVFITAAISGALTNFQLGFDSVTRLMPWLGGGMIIGWLIGCAGSIVVEMAITGALYQCGFGKGALIWLLAAVFGFLLGAVITLIVFVISAATIGNLLNNVFQFFKSGNLQYYIPAQLSVV